MLSAPLALRQFDELTEGGLGVKGSESEAVEKALARDFPGAERAHLGVVLVPEPGSEAQEMHAAIRRVDRAAAETADVELSGAARHRALADERAETLIVPLKLEGGEDASNDVAVELRERLGIAEGPKGGVRAHLIGQGALWAALSEVGREDIEDVHIIAFPIILLILLAVFGSAWAAMLPLVVGFVSVLVTGAVIYLLSQVMVMSVFAPSMAVMIGIVVAVDYSLFVLARHREEIRAGAEPAAARSTALATSGVAAAFAGLAVVVALAALWILPVQTIRSSVLAMISMVAVSVLAAVTLLPTLLDLLGSRADAPGRTAALAKLSRRRRRPTSPRSGRAGGRRPHPFWARWAELAMRRPAVSALATVAILLALPLPALGINAGFEALSSLPEDHETRVGFERAAAIAGPGAATPAQVLLRFREGRVDDPRNRAVLAEVRRTLVARPLVRGRVAVVTSDEGRAALLSARVDAHAESDRAQALVERLRDELPASVGGRAARVQIGGVTAGVLDLQALIASSLWKVMLLIVALSYPVLLLLLRSAVLPLLAALMTLLSVAAAYGVLVVVFQWGWLEGIAGLEPTGFVWATLLPFILAVVFGLSMDYSIFLFSRVQERFEATRDPRRAVVEGLASSARVITSAALVMVAVFLVFVGTGVPLIKQLGLGLAVAIAIEATLVRLILVPATMALLGHRSWWIPATLARGLSHSSSEQASA